MVMSNCGKEKSKKKMMMMITFCSSLVSERSILVREKRKVSSHWPIITFSLLLLVSSDHQMIVQSPNPVCCC